MTTVFRRLGVLCVVVAIVWCSFPRPRPDTFPASLARAVIPIARVSASSNSVSSETQTLVAKELHPILIQETPQPGPTLKDMKRRGVITFLIPHSAASYFLYRGEQMGFEYELALEFAKTLGVDLEILTPPPGTELTAWLEEGKGDIAAGVAIADEEELDSFHTSVSYLDTTAQLLTRRSDFRVREITDLAGKSIAIQPDALYARQLLPIDSARNVPSILTTVQSEESIGGAMRLMAQGQASATLVTAPLADLAYKLYPGQLRTAVSFPQTIRMVWAVRQENEALLEAINAFLDQASRSGLRKILFEKYFVTANHLRDSARKQEVTLLSKQLSRYDRLIARHAEEAGFDWRFIAALIFQESRFNHESVSGAGAYGLMQLMPIAAQDIGIKDYSHPAKNIEAGVKYLKVLARQFPDGRTEDRFALVLASYFLGPGHMEDARRLARALGHDPDCWEDSMERVLPLLEKAKYYRRAQYGAAQGRQAVHYVNAIRKRYMLYAQHVSRKLPEVRKRTKEPPQAASVAG